MTAQFPLGILAAEGNGSMAFYASNSFWEGGASAYLDGLAKQHAEQLMALVASLRTETDEQQRRRIKLKIDQIERAYRQRCRAAAYGLF